ncbi:MAG TPA: glycoside hydrolase family 3 C-terminal domain-containing protein [Polyangiaceae bacterium]
MQYLLGGAATLAMVGLAAAACQHAAAVQQLEDNAKRTANAASGSGGSSSSDTSGSSTTGDPGLPSGESFMKATETELTADFTGDPVVDGANRMSCGDTAYGDTYTSDPADQAEAQTLLGQMTIDQKVVQLTGIGSPNYEDPNRWEDIQRSYDDEALNIRGYQWRDGPHGLNLESGLGRDALPENYSTSFPTSVAQGATFDLDVVYRVAEAIADETVASGNMVMLGPCMNILRHPYWGRAQETFGEDTFHLGRIATAFTLGLQQFITGCAKHYLGNNIENQRFHISANMDEQTLREVYARHFEMVVRDGGVGCIMASYNKVNGVKSTQNKHTLTTMLREDMGFRGFVLTDWWAMPGANDGQGPVNAPADLLTAAEAIQAGLDVEVPWALNYDALPALVADGTIQESLVNRAVLRVLEQKLRFNSAYLDEPIGLKQPTTTYDSASGSVRNTEAHAALSTEMAEKAAVLLRNDDGVLPIRAATTVAVIGAKINYTVPSDNPPDKVFDFARDAALGDRGSSRVRPNPALTVGPLAGITAEAPQGVTVTAGETAAEAADADYAVVIVGLTAGHEGEEYTGASDRRGLSLPGGQDMLVTDVVAARAGKPTIVIVEAGSVVAMPWIDQVDAAIMAWYPGQTAGTALGRLLFGKTNFGGRLPVTWPAMESQLPVFNEGDSTQMDYFIGYRRFDELGLEPLFPFGHGLSYSTFRYERLHVPCAGISKHGILQVEVDVRNTSEVAGDEVVMVYASYPGTQARRSKKELKGFHRVHLEPGQGKRVSIPVRVQDLKYWSDASGWAIDPTVTLQVGPASDPTLLAQDVTIQ